MGTDISFLAEKAKNGDVNAFSALYDMFKTDLYRFALYSVKNEYDAEDAVQEAVISCWRNIASLRDNALFKPWLFKILSNKCKKILVSKSKNPECLPDEEYEFLLDEKDEGYSFKSCELLEALKSLTPPDGQIVLLSIIGGFKSEEIAKIYNLPPGTVRSKQKRALEKLKKFLTDERSF